MTIILQNILYKTRYVLSTWQCKQDMNTATNNKHTNVKRGGEESIGINARQTLQWYVYIPHANIFIYM